MSDYYYPEDMAIGTMSARAKEKARAIKKEEASSPDDIILQLRFWWSRHYNRPMFDPILENYTIEQLFLEFYLHTPQDDEKDANEIIKENEEELGSLFEDLPSFGKMGVQKKEVSDEEFLDKELGENNWQMSENEFQ